MNGRVGQTARGYYVEKYGLGNRAFWGNGEDHAPAAAAGVGLEVNIQKSVDLRAQKGLAIEVPDILQPKAKLRAGIGVSRDVTLPPNAPTQWLQRRVSSRMASTGPRCSDT